MNILQILPRLEVGGVERGTVDLARFLTLNAHKAVVVSQGGRLVKHLDEVGARHYTLPVGKKDPVTITRMVFKLRDIIKKEDIDIIHARSRVPALIGFFASRLTARTFITTAHGQYKKHIMSYVMGWGKYVIVASTVMARYMVDNFGVRPDKIKIIPRGVDTEKFPFRSPADRKGREFRIGMVSRISPIKGHLDFLRAASLLSRSVSNLKVFIVGKVEGERSDYVKEIELLIKRMALSRIVTFVEETEDVYAVLSELDILISANREQEAFGRVIIEAQSSGVPCVATRVGGIVDIIKDGVTGLLCEPANPRDLADKITALYKDEDLRNKIARNARQAVEEEFTLSKMMKRTLKVYEQAKEEKRILIIKISALGDVILNVPSIRAIREKYPKATIKVLVGLDSRDIVKNLPYIDELIVCDFKNRDKGILGLSRIARRVNNEDFDIVVDFQNNRKSHVLAFFSCAPLRYGYDNGKWGLLLNRRVKDAGVPMDPVRHQMMVLGLLGIYNINKELVLFPAADDISWAKGFLKDNWINPAASFVVIHLESSPRWLTKRWPVNNYIKLAEKIAKELLVRVVITGHDPDDEWVAGFLRSAKCKPVSAAGKTSIGRLIGLIDKASLVITPDSAPMHIASAVKTPFVALYGPTSPKRHTPPSGMYRVLNKKLNCSPCYKPVCNRGYECMKAITVDEAFRAVKELLETADKKSQA